MPRNGPDGIFGRDSGLPDAGIKHKRQVIGDPKQASEKFPKVHREAPNRPAYCFDSELGDPQRQGVSQGIVA